MTFCTGYLAGWITNLHNFRARSLVERFFWSVPLSMAVSAVSATLIYRFFSLAAVLTLFLASAVACLVILGREYLQLRHSGERWKFGWQPLGGSAMLVAIGWMIVVIFSVIDFQSNHNLYASVTILDYSARVNWIESILRTGVPPHNSLYFYKQPATMRNYYFWYVMCAVVSRMAHLPVRAVLNASCVWAGFAVAALNGLYLKHFLRAGSRLRRQFLYSILLLTVTGLDIAVILWQVLYLRLPPQPDAEAWSRGAVLSWLDVFLYAPHHLVCLVCCMLAFLLAWMSNGKEGGRLATIAFISLAFASAFGLSVYLSFAFFLLMLVWAHGRFSLNERLGPYCCWQRVAWEQQSYCFLTSPNSRTPHPECMPVARSGLPSANDFRRWPDGLACLPAPDSQVSPCCTQPCQVNFADTGLCH